MRKDCRDPRAERMNFLVEIAFTFGVGDAISFCLYGYLCKIVPQISRVKA